MSMLYKQIDELREYGRNRKGELAKLVNDAADTIEELRLKVAKGNFIVFCRECKNYRTPESVKHAYETCQHHLSAVEPDDYCSYGERKDG